jgi:flagellar biogenesis protein FliO
MTRIMTCISNLALILLFACLFMNGSLDPLAIPLAVAEEAALPGLALGGTHPGGLSSSIMSTSARMIGGLFLCLGVFAVVVRLLKRHGARSGAGRRRIEVRERIALSSKASLTLVAIDNKEFLVASGSESVSILPTRAIPPGLFAESLDEVTHEVEAFNA